MVEIGKYYYATTPRSKQNKTQERIKILDIKNDIVKCITVNPLKIEMIYNISISDIKIM